MRSTMIAMAVTALISAFGISAQAMGSKPQQPAPAPNTQPSGDAVEQMRDYTRDSRQSTTPADVFMPGSTEPIRRDDGNE
jgi:hypothetical protein